LAALRALEEERDVLKKQVDNLRSQARNSRARAASIHEADDAAIKEQVEALRKEVADKDTLLSKLRAEARDARDECKRLMGLLEVNVRTDGAQVEALRVEARDARQMCDAQTALAAYVPVGFLFCFFLPLTPALQQVDARDQGADDVAQAHQLGA